jgi:hypothetical protein
VTRRRDERGSATVFMIGFAMVLFLCAGLVIDGGLAINKRMRIADDAEQAARIGADSIDVNEFRRTEKLVINQQLAQQRINGYMSDLGYGSGNFEVKFPDGHVWVRVNAPSKTYILQMVGVKYHPYASAEALPDTGLVDPGQPNPGQPDAAP